MFQFFIKDELVLKLGSEHCAEVARKDSIRLQELEILGFHEGTTICFLDLDVAEDIAVEVGDYNVLSETIGEFCSFFMANDASDGLGVHSEVVDKLHAADLPVLNGAILRAADDIGVLVYEAEAVNSGSMPSELLDGLFAGNDWPNKNDVVFTRGTYNSVILAEFNVENAFLMEIEYGLFIE
jgi:hypothetical protein